MHISLTHQIGSGSLGGLDFWKKQITLWPYLERHATMLSVYWDSALIE